MYDNAPAHSSVEEAELPPNDSDKNKNIDFNEDKSDDGHFSEKSPQSSVKSPYGDKVNANSK